MSPLVAILIVAEGAFICTVILGATFFASYLLGLVFFHCDCLYLASLAPDVVGRAEEGKEVVELPQGNVEGLEVLVYFHLSCSRQSS